MGKGRGGTHLDHITQELVMMGGKACIRRMRVTVGKIGALQSIGEIFADYPYLEREVQIASA
jgi:uncharacterized protein (DUF433 family)